MYHNSAITGPARTTAVATSAALPWRTQLLHHEHDLPYLRVGGHVTLFHHPPRPEEVREVMLDPIRNVERAVQELRENLTPL